MSTCLGKRSRVREEGYTSEGPALLRPGPFPGDASGRSWDIQGRGVAKASRVLLTAGYSHNPASPSLAGATANRGRSPASLGDSSASLYTTLLADGNAAPHERMYLAVVRECPRRAKPQRERLSGLQCFGVERPIIRRHGVRGRIVVRPGDGRPWGYGDVGWVESKVLDAYRLLVALCSSGRHSHQHSQKTKSDQPQ